MTTVYLNPTQNVAAIVSANPAGTTFMFASGVYSNVDITPKNYDSFIGQGAVTLTGSVPISGWTSSGGYWSAGGFPANGFSPGTADPGRDGLAQVPEDLYVNGTPYLRVGSLAAVGAGDFYYSNGRVYISDNPTGKTTTASTSYEGFNGDNTIGVTIQNMTLREYASFASHGAIEAHGSSGWTVTDVNAVDNHGVGLAGGSNMTVTGGNYSDDGQLGLQVYAASNVVINGVTADNNNWAGYGQGWGAGGIKILTTNGVTVENSQISSNTGNGLWFDTDNQNVSILNNNISDNQGLGIEYEASFNATISGNKLSYNAQSGYTTGYWGAGLLLQDSQSVTATNNLVIVNPGAEGIGMMDDTRAAYSLGQPSAQNNTVEYNTIVMLGHGLNGGASDGASSSQIFKGTNIWNYNTYIAPNAQDVNFTWNNAAYWAVNLKNPPIDANGTFIYQANPLAAIASTPPVVTGVAASPASGRELPGSSVTFAVSMDERVTVAGGAPSLNLNNGGSATYNGGSGTNVLTFRYTVGSTDTSVSALAITGVTLPAGVTIQDSAGNKANMGGAVTTFSGLSVGLSSEPSDPWSAYLAGGLPTSNLVVSTGGSILNKSTQPTTLYGAGYQKIDLYGNTSNAETNYVGGAGRQFFILGGGANLITELAVSDSSTQSGVDSIQGFDTTKDVIDLSRIDANLGVAGIQNFTYIGTAAFSGTGAQVRYEIVGGNTTVEAKLAGDSSADMTMTVSGSAPISAANFALTAAASKSAATAAASLSVAGQASSGSLSELSYTGLQGHSYTSYNSINTHQTILAQNYNLSASTNQISLIASDVTITRGSSAESIAADNGSFSQTYHTNESVQIASTAGTETLKLGPHFGSEAITGFVASGASADAIILPVASFSYLTGSMTQVQDLAAVLAHATSGSGGLAIGDSFGDTLTLSGVSASTVASSSSIRFA